MTEEEQLERLKNWWQRYSTPITTTLCVILLAFSGYKYWSQHESKMLSEASNAYEQMMNSFSSQDNKKVRSFANQIISVYPNTVYADVARLTLTKLYISRDNYPKAKNELEYVAKHSKVAALKEMAKIRLARLTFAEKDFDHALDELDQIKTTSFTPVINELKGDIYMAKGQQEKAFSFYKEAYIGLAKLKVNNFFLEMKINEIAPNSSWKNEVQEFN